MSITLNKKFHWE